MHAETDHQCCAALRLDSTGLSSHLQVDLALTSMFIYGLRSLVANERSILMVYHHWFVAGGVGSGWKNWVRLAVTLKFCLFYVPKDVQ